MSKTAKTSESVTIEKHAKSTMDSDHRADFFLMLTTAENGTTAIAETEDSRKSARC